MHKAKIIVSFYQHKLYTEPLFQGRRLREPGPLLNNRPHILQRENGLSGPLIMYVNGSLPLPSKKLFYLTWQFFVTKLTTTHGLERMTKNFSATLYN